MRVALPFVLTIYISGCSGGADSAPTAPTAPTAHPAQLAGTMVSMPFSAPSASGAVFLVT